MPSQLHHFVPQFHLRRFTDPTQKRELIWVYERGKEKPELRALDHVAAQKNYYTIESEDGTKLQEAETLLSRLEGVAAPILRRLEDNRRLSKEDRSTVALFLAFGSLRTPKFRDAADDLYSESLRLFSRKLASDPVKFAEAVKSTEAALGRPLGDPEDLRRVITEERVKLTTGPGYSIKVMFEDAFEHAAMFENMIWSLCDADEDTPLVTSDNPVVLNNQTVFEGNGPPTPLGLEIVFPISPKVVLLATWDGHFGAGQLSGARTRQINKLMSLAADKYVYAPTEIPAVARYLQGPRKGPIPEFLKAKVLKKISENWDRR
jgi:Protein of unknown function (DUF4238)